jgi:hypothetical protein
VLVVPGPVERPGEVAANGYQVITAALPGPVAGVDVADSVREQHFHRLADRCQAGLRLVEHDGRPCRRAVKPKFKISHMERTGVIAFRPAEFADISRPTRRTTRYRH